MKNAAASKIQAFWRGYCVRKKLGTKRNMSLLVLMPGNTLADIKINLIEKMKKANNLQLLLKNLRMLDIITTASPQLSFDLVQEEVVQQLYELMYKLNRNVGDQQARHLIVIVLVNLTKHNETSDIYGR
ncbi:abnormal spindle-like microcephaly-associated protein homolog isoform X2 [Lycorma delicatula]|uniref:abnormal spindle-like microcephaly-associated protein homolog isoform X1 n=1 Tax=Lycorma delicatula TaxID=130591 RepID=UPI003F514836